jgi:hypothetical protein
MTSSELDRLRHYDELAARIYTDDRMNPGTREIALAMAWVQFRHRGSPAVPDAELFWERLSALLGRGTSYHPRMTILLGEDAPRYEPPWPARANSGICEGPRMRPYRPRNQTPAGRDCIVHAPHDYVDPPPRDNRVCGANATIKVIEHNMVTGWARAHWFCRRHADHAANIRARIDAMGTPPEPIPNTGGILPCYFNANWDTIYARHRPGWKSPYHGVRADSWPAPSSRQVPRPPRLAVVRTLS